MQFLKLFLVGLALLSNEQKKNAFISERGNLKYSKKESKHVV